MIYDSLFKMSSEAPFFNEDDRDYFGTEKIRSATIVQDGFDLPNLKLLLGNYTSYHITVSFYFKITSIVIDDIHPFLTYHFEQSNDKSLFIDTLKTEFIKTLYNTSEPFTQYDRERRIPIIESWIRGKANTTPSVSNPKKAPKTTYEHWALYFYYCQRKGIFPSFEDFPNIKIKTFEDFCKERNLKSVKRFQLDYNEISKSKNRLHPSNLKSIGYVLTLLQDVPEAYKLANDEYKTVNAKS